MEQIIEVSKFPDLQIFQFAGLCHGSCFFGYTAENIKRSDVLIGENTSKKTGKMSSNFGEIIKKLISVFG
jgi:hypothetical protein